MTPYFQDETTTIYLADNREVLPALPVSSVDMVFTSPPYNLGDERGNYPTSGLWRSAQIGGGYASYEDAMPHAEYIEWQKAFLLQCWPLLSTAGALFYNHKPRIVRGALRLPADYIPSELRKYLRQEIIWARGGGMNFSPTFYCPTHERILVLAKPNFKLRDKPASGVGDVWRIDAELNTQHPAPFPLELPKRAIETTTAEVILDPFMGSGTVGVACAIQGRRFIGIELEEKYCELAVARIKRAKGIACDIPRLITRPINTPLFNTPETV